MDLHALRRTSSGLIPYLLMASLLFSYFALSHQAAVATTPGGKPCVFSHSPSLHFRLLFTCLLGDVGHGIEGWYRGEGEGICSSKIQVMATNPMLLPCRRDRVSRIIYLSSRYISCSAFYCRIKMPSWECIRLGQVQLVSFIVHGMQVLVQHSGNPGPKIESEL